LVFKNTNSYQDGLAVLESYLGPWYLKNTIQAAVKLKSNQLMVHLLQCPKFDKEAKITHYFFTSDTPTGIIGGKISQLSSKCIQIVMERHWVCHGVLSKKDKERLPIPEDTENVRSETRLAILFELSIDLVTRAGLEVKAIIGYGAYVYKMLSYYRQITKFKIYFARHPAFYVRCCPDFLSLMTQSKNSSKTQKIIKMETSCCEIVFKRTVAEFLSEIITALSTILDIPRQKLLLLWNHITFLNCFSKIENLEKEIDASVVKKDSLEADVPVFEKPTIALDQKSRSFQIKSINPSFVNYQSFNELRSNSNLITEKYQSKDNCMKSHKEKQSSYRVKEIIDLNPKLLVESLKKTKNEKRNLSYGINQCVSRLSDKLPTLTRTAVLNDLKESKKLKGLQCGVLFKPINQPDSIKNFLHEILINIEVRENSVTLQLLWKRCKVGSRNIKKEEEKFDIFGKTLDKYLILKTAFSSKISVGIMKMTTEVKNWFDRCCHDLYTAKELVDFETNRTDFSKEPCLSKTFKEFPILWSTKKNYVADLSTQLLNFKVRESQNNLISFLDHCELVQQSYKFGKKVVQTRNLGEEKQKTKCSFNVVDVTKDDSNVHFTLFVPKQPKPLVITFEIENANDFSVSQFRPACFTLFFKSSEEMYLRRNFGLGNVFN
jgi:hypothetical protein